MTKIDDLYIKYGNVDPNDLTKKSADCLRGELSAFQKSELQTMEDHKKYIELLAKCRSFSYESMKTLGSQFLKTLGSLLAVGEDGVYTNKMRFLYELIQNVDDCDYEDISDCNLEVFFESSNEDTAKIVFAYNELGFTPANVFAITGIAEAAKNISEEKVEIGEKGIGFKSVFGIADKVYIQSGRFSFYFTKDNIIVPVPFYDGFKEVQGTKLTIVTDRDTARSIYSNIANTYAKKEAILKQNPILFLNKLTHLKIYQDGFDYVEFNVERKNPGNICGIAFEDNVKVSVKMKQRRPGIGNDVEINQEINCVRYVMPIVYGRKECQSRYGEDTRFMRKRHDLIAIVPLDSDYGNEKGLLYSFLPTQIEIQAPVVLHVPFKLDGSREYVDPQGYNSWFKFTIEHVEIFVKAVYRHLCTIVKNRICSYIPRKNTYFFYCSNDKVRCICTGGLLGESIVQESIFISDDGKYYSANNVVFIEKGELKCKVEVLHRLLRHHKKLFVPSALSDGILPKIDAYGVEVIRDVSSRLLSLAWQDELHFDEIADVLTDLPSQKIIDELNANKYRFFIRPSQIKSIAHHKNFKDAFTKYGRDFVMRYHNSIVMAHEDIPCMAAEQKEVLLGLIDGSTLDAKLISYLKAINLNILVLDTGVDGFYFVANNGVVLDKATALSAFGAFCDFYDKNKTFMAVLRIRQATETLNSTEVEALSNSDYLEKLQAVRSSLVNAYGPTVYKRYIQIVNSASGNRNRFINELLQNVDDCTYPEDEVPTVKMELKDGKLDLRYNEVGFTKSNVRSITAIGESTKKKIQTGNVIGEKGIGFKSVFEVAEKVTIHSNRFDFILTSDKPTVPNKCTPMNELSGTVMRFTMKDPDYELPSSDKILQLCICLKKVKHIEIGDTIIDINDVDDKRLIVVNGEIKKFDKYTYSFKVNDKTAIKERSDGHRRISPEQSINFYTSKDYKPEKRFLYSGLPTEVQTNISLIIDAPFELTTARDSVLQNKWNNFIRAAFYNALACFMDDKKEEYAIDVLQFTGYKSQNNEVSFSVFDSVYLNDAPWLDKLKKLQVLPCLLHNNVWVSASRGDCKVIPDVVAEFVLENRNTGDELGTTIINSMNKSQYNGLLQYLGCEFIPHEKSIRFIKKYVNVFVNLPKLQSALYKYLGNPQYAFNRNDKIAPLIASMPIFPIRERMGNLVGTNYISAADGTIYHHVSYVSDQQIKVLDSERMSVEMANRILSPKYAIPPLTQQVLDKVYQDNLVYMIEHDNDMAKIASYLKSDYDTNHSSFIKCRYTLLGLLNEIPMKMQSNEYSRGRKFVSDKNKIFYGQAIQNLLIHDDYLDLARYLGCPDIDNVTFEDYDGLVLDNMDADDIQDILDNDLKNRYDILVGMIGQGVISDELVEEFGLEYYRGRNVSTEPVASPEDFPSQKVGSYSFVMGQVNRKMQYPNIYQPVEVTIWQPNEAIYPEAYLYNQYSSRMDDNACFCQMCGKRFNRNYVQKVSIVPEPSYAWNEMYLSLCLHCASDYRSMRRNNRIMAQLKADISTTNPEGWGVIEIDIPDVQKTIKFTGAHFAKVKAILDAEEKITTKTQRDIYKREKAKKKSKEVIFDDFD